MIKGVIGAGVEGIVDGIPGEAADGHPIACGVGGEGIGLAGGAPFDEDALSPEVSIDGGGKADGEQGIETEAVEGGQGGTFGAGGGWGGTITRW